MSNSEFNTGIATDAADIDRAHAERLDAAEGILGRYVETDGLQQREAVSMSALINRVVKDNRLDITHIEPLGHREALIQRRARTGAVDRVQQAAEGGVGICLGHCRNEEELEDKTSPDADGAPPRWLCCVTALHAPCLRP